MKRWKIALTAVCLLAAMVCLSGCSTYCNHSFGPWKIKREATCKRIELNKHTAIGNSNVHKIKAEGKCTCPYHQNRLGELDAAERCTALESALSDPLNTVGNYNRRERGTGRKSLVLYLYDSVLHIDRA